MICTPIDHKPSEIHVKLKEKVDHSLYFLNERFSDQSLLELLLFLNASHNIHKFVRIAMKLPVHIWDMRWQISECSHESLDTDLADAPESVY